MEEIVAAFAEGAMRIRTELAGVRLEMEKLRENREDATAIGDMREYLRTSWIDPKKPV
jgi:hypothetical protein